jgi:hypothetical protein
MITTSFIEDRLSAVLTHIRSGAVRPTRGCGLMMIDKVRFASRCKEASGGVGVRRMIAAGLKEYNRKRGHTPLGLAVPQAVRIAAAL